MIIAGTWMCTPLQVASAGEKSRLFPEAFGASGRTPESLMIISGTWMCPPLQVAGAGEKSRLFLGAFSASGRTPESLIKQWRARLGEDG